MARPIDTSNPLTVGIDQAYTFAEGGSGISVENSVRPDQGHTGGLSLVAGPWGDGQQFNSDNAIVFTGGTPITYGADTSSEWSLMLFFNSASGSATPSPNLMTTYQGYSLHYRGDNQMQLRDPQVGNSTLTPFSGSGKSYTATKGTLNASGDNRMRVFVDGSQVGGETFKGSELAGINQGNIGVGQTATDNLAYMYAWKGNPVELTQADYAALHADPEQIFLSGPPAPGQVAGVTATRQAGDVSTLVEWVAEPNAETYEVQQQLVGDVDQWQVVAAAVVGTSFTDNHAGGARREYRVRAENATDFGPWSDVAQEALLPVELSGQVDGAGSVSGAPEVATLLSGQVDGAGSVSGAPEVATLLSGQVDGAGSVSGSPVVSAGLFGRVDGTGAVAGAPEVSRLLSGQLDGIGTATGQPSVDTTVRLSGLVSGAGSVAGLPVTGPLLSGLVAGVGSVSGSIQLSRELSGQVDGAGAVRGAPVVVGEQLLCAPSWDYVDSRTWEMACAPKS